MALRALPDTSFLIDLLRGARPAVDLLDELDADGALWHLAAPVQYEIELGIQRTRSAAEDAEFRALIAPMPGLALDEVAASRSAHLQSAAFRRGRPMSDLDALILGIADRHGALLVTADRRLTDAALEAGLPVRAPRSAEA